MVAPSETPNHFRHDAAWAGRAALKAPAGRALTRNNGAPEVVARAPDLGLWAVTLSAGAERTTVLLADRTGDVLENNAWAWPQTGSPMSPFKSKTEWVMIVLSAIFIFVAADRRRLRSWQNADVVVLTFGFGIAFALFDRDQPLWAIPATIPPLLYLLFRCLRMGWRPSQAARRWDPPSFWVLSGLLAAVMGIRAGFNLLEAPVNDVGYASVLGADGIINGWGIYRDDTNHLDTYGPVAYIAFVPFTLLFPMAESWMRDGLPAAHATAVAMDVLTAALLIVLGRRIRPGREGARLGMALALVFAACPWTFFAMMLSTNDGLTPLLLIGTLLAMASPVRRGVVLGLAAAAKFSPAALLPLIATGGEPGRSGRAAIKTTVAFTVTVLVAFALLMPPGGPLTIWHETIGFQLERRSFLSVWGQYPELRPVQLAAKAAAVALIAGVAFVPRKRDLAQVCALGAAIILLLQIGLEYWTFAYVGWVVPLIGVALLTAADRVPVEQTAVARADEIAQPLRPLQAATASTPPGSTA